MALVSIPFDIEEPQSRGCSAVCFLHLIFQLISLLLVRVRRRGRVRVRVRVLSASRLKFQPVRTTVTDIIAAVPTVQIGVYKTSESVFKVSRKDPATAGAVFQSLPQDTKENH